ncbi:MAG: CoxG family protein [Chloroflexota bacterium]
MQFSGTHRIEATPQEVWNFVTDAQGVSSCVPDVQSIETVSPEQFKAVVKAGLGPVRGKFSFDVHWKEMDEPKLAKMSAQGKTPGSAVTMDTVMTLTPLDGGAATELTWTADIVVHGMIASVGARLMNGFVEKQTEQFFGCLSSKVKGG